MVNYTELLLLDMMFTSIVSVSCPELPQFVHADPSDYFLGAGTTITLTCHEDYVFANGAKSADIYCNADGDWEPEVVDCQSKIPQNPLEVYPPEVLHG